MRYSPPKTSKTIKPIRIRPNKIRKPSLIKNKPMLKLIRIIGRISNNTTTNSKSIKENLPFLNEY